MRRRSRSRWRPTRRRSTGLWPTGWSRRGSHGCRSARRASTTGCWPRSAGPTTPSASGWRSPRAGRPLDLNLDLIFGCPGEDAASWERSLEAAVAIGPEHLSAYALTIEPATKFGRMVAAGRMAEPDEDVLADRYERACAVLAAAGYAHYEVSNWARGRRAADGFPAHASLHNRTYWRRGAYLGLGAGAHEFVPEPDGFGPRRWNVPGVPEYLAAVRAGRRPTLGQEALDGEQARFEALALRLRTLDGLDGEEAGALGVDATGPAATELRSAGLLAPGPALRLTERGMFLHGEVVSRLAP